MSVMPLALLAFFGFGVLLVIPGALQPALARAYALDLAQSGGVASALLLGVLVGSLAAAPLVDRLPRRALFVASTAACALAALALGRAPSYAALCAATALLGAAGGAFETLLNAAVPQSEPSAAAPRLALAHAAATLGAALGAPLLAGLARAGSVATALAAVAAGFAAIAVVGMLGRFPAPPVASADRAASRTPLPLAALAPLALACAAYVGVETAVSVMLPALASARGLPAVQGTLAISGFWAGVFAARVVFARRGRAARRRELAIGSLAAAAALTAAGLATPAPLALWGAGAGFALGVVFPVLVVLAGDAAPERRATALALVVSAGSLGGGALPWLAGEAGATRAPFVLALGCVAIAGAVALVRRA